MGDERLECKGNGREISRGFLTSTNRRSSRSCVRGAHRDVGEKGVRVGGGALADGVWEALKGR